MHNVLYFIILSIASWLLSTNTTDNVHFYRATNCIFNEPRLEHPYLSSFDITLSGGSTSSSRNRYDRSVPLFDLYGITNISQINNQNNADSKSIVNNGQSINDNTAINNFSIGGTFSIIESNISYIQNLDKGFLFYFHLPIRSLTIKKPRFTKILLSQTTIQESQPLDEILSLYNLSANSLHSKGIGDFTSSLFWTHNYQKTRILDFIDGSLGIGVMIPTGKKKDLDKLFSLPTGYNGHWGIPLDGMLSIGAYEWITIGIYTHYLFFLQHKQCMRIKTSPNESGIVKLNSYYASQKKGAAWDTGCYFKADHFVYGLSFTASYSYAGEGKNSIIADKTNAFNNDLANSDTTLNGWNMHTLSFTTEYDFAKYDSKKAIRIGLTYNYQITGKNVFRTSTTGGSLGLDIACTL